MKFLSDAINILCPNMSFRHQNSYDSIEFINFPSDFIFPTKEEIQAKIAELEASEPLRLLRIERTRLLQESDWVTIKAYSQGVEVSAEWKTYLQALRDLPENSEPSLDEQGNLTNVIWPTPPE